MRLSGLVRWAVGWGAIGCARAATVPAAGPAPRVCLPAAADSFNYFGQLQKIATSADSISSLHRGIYQLEPTTLDQTGRITRESACRQAAAVIDSIAETPNSGRQILMFKLGTSYGAVSPAYAIQHGAHTVFILDGSFRYKVHVAMGGG